MSARIDHSDGRQRQSKRDEQIRRKLEHDLAKRKNKISLHKQSTIDVAKHYGSAVNDGTVLALKPLPPLTMAIDTPVVDAAQYMTAYRSSCVLVLDHDSAVCGIFTAKDLAFKVIAASADSKSDLRRSLTVRDIMTPQPMCVSIDSSAIDALNTMVSRGFRHLPIMDKKGEIAGVLDITKCFFEAMRKLERACESSNKLREALEGVNSEFGPNHPTKILSYVEALKEHTSGPELGAIFDDTKPPISIDVKASVQEAAVVMKRNKTTSILVTDKNQSIAGIFTTKDIVLRVLAANIDPQHCSVVRVMTPNPECAPTSMNIQEALRKMHDGKFLNLPVKNEEGEILGIVDILRLTYVTLEHLNSMTAIDGEAPSAAAALGGGATKDGEGPAWNKFWMSLNTDTDSNDGLSKVYPHGFEDLELDSKSSVSDTELAQFSIQQDDEDNQSELNSEVGRELRPEDSLSRLGISDPLPSISQAPSSSNLNASIQESTHSPVGTVPQPARAGFSFKFKAPSGRAHRIQVMDSTDVEGFRDLIAAKLSEQDISQLGGREKFAVSYLDDDRDVISITTVQDINDAIEIAKKANAVRAEIFLHHPDQTPTVKPKNNVAEGENGVMPMLVGSAAAMMFGFLAWGRK